MCEPITIGIATGLAVASSAYGAYKSYQQAQYMRDMGQRQLAIGEMSAARATEVGQAQAAAIKARTSDVVGTQVAAGASQGIDVGSGVGIKRIEDTGLKSGLDVETAKNNAALQAWGIRVGAQTDQIQSELNANAAESSAIGHILEGGGSALAGYGRFARYKGWYK